jgi:hypothetical protein
MLAFRGICRGRKMKINQIRRNPSRSVRRAKPLAFYLLCFLWYFLLQVSNTLFEVNEKNFTTAFKIMQVLCL